MGSSTQQGCGAEEFLGAQRRKAGEAGGTEREHPAPQTSATGSRGRLIPEKHPVIEDRGENASKQRAGPVNAVVLPVVSGQRGSEGAGGVHGRAGERTSEKNVDRDYQADRETCNLAEGAFRVHGRGEND